MNEAQVEAGDSLPVIQPDNEIQPDNYTLQAQAMLPSQDYDDSTPLRKAITEYGSAVVSVQTRLAQETMQLNTEVDQFISEKKAEKDRLQSDFEARTILNQQRDAIRAQQDEVWSEIESLRIDAVRENLARIAAGVGKYIPIRQIRERSVTLGERMKRLAYLRRENAKLDVARRPISDSLFSLPSAYDLEQDVVQVRDRVEERHQEVARKKEQVGILSSEEDERLSSSYREIELRAEDELYVHHDERQKHFNEALTGVVSSDLSLQSEKTRLIEAGAIDEFVMEDAQKMAAEILADFDAIELGASLKKAFEGRYKERLSTFLVTQGLERFDTVTTQNGKPLSFQEQRLRAVLTARIIGAAAQQGIIDSRVSDRHLAAAIATLESRLYLGNRHYADSSESVQIAFELIQAVQDPLKRDELIQAQLHIFMPDFFKPDAIPSNKSLHYFTLLPSIVRDSICERYKGNKFIKGWFAEQALRRVKQTDPRTGNAIRSPIIEKSPLGFSPSKAHPYSYFHVDDTYDVWSTSLYDAVSQGATRFERNTPDTYRDDDRSILFSASELTGKQQDIWFSDDEVRGQRDAEADIRGIVKDYCDKLGDGSGEPQTLTIDFDALQKLFPSFPSYNRDSFRDMHIFITALRNSDYLEGSNYRLEVDPGSDLDNWSRLLNAYSRQIQIPNYGVEIEYPGGFQFIPPQEDGDPIAEHAAKLGKFYDFSHPIPQPRDNLFKGFVDFQGRDFGLNCFYEIAHGLPIDKASLRDLPEEARDAYIALHSGLLQDSGIALEVSDDGYVVMQGVELAVDADTQELSLSLNKSGFTEIIESNQARLASLKAKGIIIPLADYGLPPDVHFMYQTYLETGLSVPTLEKLIQNNNWNFEISRDGRVTSPEFNDFYVFYSQVAEAYPRQFGEYLSSQNAEVLFSLYKEYPMAELSEVIALMQENDINAQNINIFKNVVSKLVTTEAAKREPLLKIIQAITDSPVSDITMLADELIDQILETDNPEEAFRKIEAVFIRNNIPHIGKIFVIFRTLYPEARLDRHLNNTLLSPALRESNGDERYEMIFHDLMRVSVDSASRSIMTYLNGFQDIDDLVKRFEEDSSSLGADEIQQLEYFSRRAETLYDYSLLGQREQQLRTMDGLPLEEKIHLIKQAFKIQPGQTFGDRVVRMYLGPLGFRTVEGVRNYVEERRNQANMRNRTQLVSDGSGGYRFELQKGFLIKAIPSEVVGKVFDNGILAREYLGIKSEVDRTPFDSDFSVISVDSDADFADSWKDTMSSGDGLGDILVVVNPNRGRLSDVRDELTGRDGRLRYELIHSTRDDHQGIRTGLGSTEIDGIICKRDLDFKRLDEIFIVIAQKGLYIPVVNKEGRVIFTPEMYDEYRRTFDGIPELGKTEIRVSPVSAQSPLRALIDPIIPLKAQDVKEQSGITSRITERVSSALAPLGIGVQDKYDTGLLGARIIDTGSTGRHTNKPGDGSDYDFVVRLNARDIGSVAAIVKNVTETLKFNTFRLEPVQGSGGQQLRLFGVTGLSDEPIDIDIGFQTFTHEAVMESHDVNERRLASIRAQQGEDVYIEVLSGIALAKKLLSEGGAYKKPDGGFGGIGVENWILQHQGNIEQAFRSFWDAAHDAEGEVVSFEQFQQNYHILDPGINLRYGQHDNYARVLKRSGYEKMLAVIGRFIHYYRL